ncbi:MAG: LysM peptidoglycan-binding domain-containing protein [Luteolibacter sp.]
MIPIRILTPALLAATLASCGSRRADIYDTPTNSYAAQDPASATVTDPASTVYDVPAAYDDTTISPATSNIASAEPLSSSAPEPSATTAPPAPPSSPYGAATIHTVVAGDTLSGISAKYKIPADSIRQANRMTSDVVILGRKMVIPPR